ncbi:hypothetical protein [Desulfosarcina sp.]|uniref:hypothetical protein n=1 Tax=Desulfosarcina sp. TaxID=2027861 RepID=UPI0039711023
MNRTHRTWSHGGWMVCLVGALFCAAAATSVAAPEMPEEIHFYREVTGESVKEVSWRLRKGALLVLTYSSPVERHVTTTGPDYDTRHWQVVAENGQTDLSAERMNHTIVVHGRFEGSPVDKRLEIDDSPWYQATSLSLREMVSSDDTERVFWTIRSDTLTAHKIRAIKKGVETIDLDGNRKELLRIRLTLLGMLAPFWKSDYWFAAPEGIFYRFKGPSGPPGSPMTVVTRTAG